MTSGALDCGSGISSPLSPKARNAASSVSRRGGARHGHLAVVRVDHAQRAAHVGDDVDVGVAQHEAPRLRVVAGGREHGVAHEEGELLARRSAAAGKASRVDRSRRCSEGSVSAMSVLRSPRMRGCSVALMA